MPKLPEIVICDIDGTVALHTEQSRHHFDYSKVLTDLPNDNVIWLVQQILHAWEAEVIFLSGREDSCRADTLRWLDAHIFKDDIAPKLFMRKTGDHRKDNVVKHELYAAHIEPYYNVRLVLEDRDQMVELWRSLGLTCLQVADGNF